MGEEELSLQKVLRPRVLRGVLDVSFGGIA
jgi:hypothetical protein